MRKTVKTKMEIYNEVVKAIERADQAVIAMQQAEGAQVGSVAMGVIAKELQAAQANLKQVRECQMIPAFNTEGMR